MVCVGNSYQIKDTLKDYGYKWLPTKKVWHKELKNQHQLFIEMRFILITGKWSFLGTPEALVEFVNGVG